MLNLNKKQLDFLATVFGFIGGISGVFAFHEVPPKKVWAVATGISTFLVGFLAQRPAYSHPTTSEVERKPHE